MSTLGTARRYYLAKRHAAAEFCDKALELLWAGKQLAEPATVLPAAFPYRARLQALGYVAFEDLAGADACELTQQGFSSREAAAILAELPA